MKQTIRTPGLSKTLEKCAGSHSTIMKTNTGHWTFTYVALGLVVFSSHSHRAVLHQCHHSLEMALVDDACVVWTGFGIICVEFLKKQMNKWALKIFLTKWAQLICSLICMVLFYYKIICLAQLYNYMSHLMHFHIYNPVTCISLSFNLFSILPKPPQIPYADPVFVLVPLHITTLLLTRIFHTHRLFFLLRR